MAHVPPFDAVCIDDSRNRALRFGSAYRVVEVDGPWWTVAESADIPMLPVHKDRLRRPEDLPLWAAREVRVLRARMTEINGLLTKYGHATLALDSAHYTEGARGDFSWSGEQTREWNAEKRRFEEHRGYSA